jgi:hypothetical protein
MSFTANFAPINTDCSPNAAANSDAINSVLNNGNVISSSLQAVKPLINELRGYASSKTNEYGLAVQYNYGQYYIYNNANLGDTPNYWNTGTPNSVLVAYTDITYLVAHTHPEGQNPAPSPSDAIFLANAYNKGSKNITANVVFAADGSEYMVYVNDRNILDAFCYRQSNSQFFERDGVMFKSGTVWANDYNAAYSSLKNTLSDSDAQMYALSYVLDKYCTGLKIYQKPANTSNFKEKNTVRSNNNYSTKTCP